MLRLIGVLALLYLAYWAGTNGYGISELMAYVDSVVDTVSQ